ncbi:MAG: DUF3150 domain-containing protein [Desulfobacteraceae bacterium]|jgi:hypothetical protein
MDQDRLKEGVLCSLKMGRWNASTKLNPDEFGDKVPREIMKASQDLIHDRSILNDLAHLRRRAKYALLMNSMPFPVDNVFFVPKHKITELDDLFNEIRAEYDSKTEELVSRYSALKREFRKRYPAYYKSQKYPSKQGLRSKFYFYWNFFQFDIPDKDSGVLPPSLYKKEAEKFRNMVSQMEEMTINMIGNLLYKRVKTLETQCESGSINAATVQSVENFITKWEDLWEGHVDQIKFKNIINSLRREMKKTSTEVLKDNEQVRIKLGSKLGKIIDRIQNVPNLELKRRLDI